MFAYNIFHCLSSPPGHSHIFRPQIVKSIARPSSPSPFSADAPPLASTPPLPKSHPSIPESGNQRQKYGNSSYFCLSLSPIPLSCYCIFHFSLLFPSPPHRSLPSSLLSSGAQGAWLTSGSAPIGGDITPVPLLSSPDLDALCDPMAPALTASLPRSSPPRSSSLSTSVVFSSPHPQLAVSPSAPPAQIISCQSGTQQSPITSCFLTCENVQFGNSFQQNNHTFPPFLQRSLKM